MSKLNVSQELDKYFSSTKLERFPFSDKIDIPLFFNNIRHLKFLQFWGQSFKYFFVCILMCGIVS